MKLPNGDYAIVPLEKLRGYCLNPRHRVGGHKAHVFEAVLGLTAAQAEELQQHLLAIARTGEAVLGVQNAYGQRYIIDFAMTTAVGTAVVRSIWIVLIGQDAGPFSFRFSPGCSWERHAPAWLPEPGWSPAFPGKSALFPAQVGQLNDPDRTARA
jgi:hypothetical protein